MLEELGKALGMYPVSLVLEKRSGLFEDLGVGFLLGDVGGEGCGFGVNLCRCCVKGEIRISIRW